MLIPLGMAKWCIPFLVTLTLTLTLASFLGLSCLEHISYIKANFPQMCLMPDQFLWGHSSRDCDISCFSLKLQLFLSSINWMLKRTISLRQFFWVPTTYFWFWNKKNDFQLSTFICHFTETVLLCTHNICFCWEIRKTIFNHSFLLAWYYALIMLWLVLSNELGQCRRLWY